jgi:hypothetical protein
MFQGRKVYTDKVLLCFRGEKLYVTKAEGSSGRWKKILCWVLALLLLAGAIAVAVLIGGDKEIIFIRNPLNV